MANKKIKGFKRINISKNKYKKETEILLVRHGFTPANNAAWNKQEGLRDVFRYDELCPLDNEYGVEQAKELGSFLGKYISGKKVLFLVSPYERTRQTLRIARESFPDSSNLITYIQVPVLREINAGPIYGVPKHSLVTNNLDNQAFFDLKDSNNNPAISYPYGESELDAQRRLRSFSKKLKEIKQSGKYDIIIVLSHQIINKNLHLLLYGKGLNQKTASVIKAGENPEVIFEPETFVPKGYEVNLMEYQESKYKKHESEDDPDR